MKAAFRTFLMLGLPGMLVLLGGFPAMLRTGQVDPRGWMAAALLLIPAAFLLRRRRGEGAAWWVGLGTFGMILSCAFLAAWRVPALPPLLWFLAVAGLALIAGLTLARPDRARAGRAAGAGLVLLAMALCWCAGTPHVDAVQAEAPAKRPRLAVVSALPLFWRASESGLAAKADAPIITLLRQRFDLLPTDSLLALERGHVDALLLAQPRGVTMDELVALDAWIGRGGRALILADPQLRWPMDLPPGDRRRPPVITPLAAMIEYWGAKLMPPSAGEERRFLGDGRVLTVFAASGFTDAGARCRILARGLVARCRIGKGIATVVADADLIDDRLWLVDPAAPLDPDQWTADTPQFVAEALGGTLPDGRRWVRSGDALIRALRWSILVGIFWAALGTALFWWRRPAPSDRSRPRLALPKPDNRG